ncbi:MAG: hypothetical protein QGD93_11440 [Actinomycetota bacterium]|nr:hypothetical protein [Actinomycetota bacterium]
MSGFIFSAMIDVVSSCDLILKGDKTLTWRPFKVDDRLIMHTSRPADVVRVYRKEVVMWRIGGDYAVQPGRGKDAVCRIVIEKITLKTPDVYTEAELKMEGFTGHPSYRSRGFIDLLQAMYRGRGNVRCMLGYAIQFRLDE